LRNNCRIYELKNIIYNEYLKAFKECRNQNDQSLLNHLKIRAKYIKESWKRNLYSLYTTNEENLFPLYKEYMIEILKSNNLTTDNELLEDTIILLEDYYKYYIDQNHKITFDKIEKNKIEQQKKN
jgi:hypothetical protein